MRASGSGPFGVILMIAPLVAVPVLAIVGIPQFAPVVASPSEDFDDLPDSNLTTSALRGGRVGESRRHSAEDLFAPLSDDDASNVSAIENQSLPRDRGRWDEQPTFGGLHDRGDRESRNSNLPAEALRGWAVEELADEAEQAERDERQLDQGREELADAHGSAVEDSPFANAEPELSAAPASRRPATPRNRRRAPPVEVAEEATHNPFEEESPAPRARGGSVRRAQTATPQPDPRDRSDRSHLVLPEQRVETPRAPQRTSARMQDTLTWQAATQRLKELGIHKHVFTYLEDHRKFVFSCTVADGGSKEQQKFEAEADEPLLAVGDVLTQIDTWKTARNQRADRN